MISTEFSRSGQLGPRHTKADILVGAKVAMIPCTIKGEPAMKEHAKVVGRNLVEYWTPDGDRVLRYHRTDIIKYIGGTSAHMILNTNSYRTKTTKDALNIGMHPVLFVSQTKGEWFLHCRPQGRRKGWVVPFYDGMEITGLKKPKADNSGRERDKMLRKKIAVFLEHVASLWPKEEVGYVNEDRSNAVIPLPSEGDCMICRMTVQGVIPDCIEGHMDEKYVHGTLILNAFKWCNHKPIQTGLLWNNRFWVIKTLRRYLKAQLGLVR